MIDDFKVVVTWDNQHVKYVNYDFTISLNNIDFWPKIPVTYCGKTICIATLLLESVTILNVGIFAEMSIDWKALNITESDTIGLFAHKENLWSSPVFRVLTYKDGQPENMRIEELDITIGKRSDEQNLLTYSNLNDKIITCDCGAIKCGTTHATWCSLYKNNWK